MEIQGYCERNQHQLINTQASAIAVLPENVTQVHVLQAVARIPF